MRYLLVCLLLLGCGAPQPAPVEQNHNSLRARPAQPVQPARPHVFAPPPKRIDVRPRGAAGRSAARRGKVPGNRIPGSGGTGVSTGVIDIEASWYGKKFHGRRTASGETFDMYGMTAAHKTLPFGTRVRVIHPATGDSIEVKINDRCARHGEIDLARGAAEKLGIIRAGRLRVGMEILD